MGQGQHRFAVAGQRRCSGMDAALLVLALAGQPIRIDPRAAWFPGQLAPLVIPATALPAPERAALLLREARLPLGVRVGTALAWGQDAQALEAAVANAGPISADTPLSEALRRWANATCLALGMPADATILGVSADGSIRAATPEERGALADARELLSQLPWPRWSGPLLLVPYGVDHPAIAVGRARVLRAAVPVLRIPGGPAPRAELCAAIAALALDLTAPPRDGWPGWLTAGVGGCARARGSGEGIPERPMAERRADAGTEAIRAMLSGETAADPGLATAVCAALLHPSRRAHFPDLLDPLRHGIGGAAAIEAVYGLTIDALARKP
jgi:hypothetical protein